MELVFPADTADFEVELGAWLTARLADVRAEVGGDDVAFANRWQGLLYDNGWATPTWPQEYGGRGLDALHATLALEVFAAHGAPFPRPSGGELLLGPTILHWGNDEQRTRFLPSIAAGGRRGARASRSRSPARTSHRYVRVQSRTATTGC